MPDGTREVWSPFVRAALGLALSAGFGLGGFLFAASALQLPVGMWWAAAAQAHGHAQLFGWVGLPICGIGWHFLPRLRGAPHADPRRAALALGLLASGLIGRALAQPTLAAGLPAPGALRALLVTTGALELTGATIVLAAIQGLPRQGPPLRGRQGFRAIWPLVLVAFAACWLALALNLAGLAQLGWSGGKLVAVPLDRAVIDLALYGFLLPMAIAMSARLFPLYYRTPPARPAVLHTGLALTVLGLACRLAGDARALPIVAGSGRLIQAGGLGLFVLGLGVFTQRRPAPRGTENPLADAPQIHALTAYGWLLLAGLVLGWQGLAALLPGLPAPPDVERHLLGAGFYTLLILGVGARLLPGFARRPLRRAGLCWLTLALGNGAALLRVGPFLAPAHLPTLLPGVALPAAGLCGIGALGLFAWNLAGTARGNGEVRP